MQGNTKARTVKERRKRCQMGTNKPTMLQLLPSLPCRQSPLVTWTVGRGAEERRALAGRNEYKAGLLG